MLIAIILVIIWFILMLRSAIVEYKYYKSVKTLEPDIWSQLGSPAFLKVPVLFVYPHGAALLKEATDETVRDLAIKHKQAGLLFIAYITSVLIGLIFYFKYI